MANPAESFRGSEVERNYVPLTLERDREMLSLATFREEGFAVDQPWIEKINHIVDIGDKQLRSRLNRDGFSEVIQARRELLQEFGWLDESTPMRNRITGRKQIAVEGRYPRTKHVITNLRILYEHADDEMMTLVLRGADFVFLSSDRMQATTTACRDLGYDTKLLFRLSPYLFIDPSTDAATQRAAEVLRIYGAPVEAAEAEAPPEGSLELQEHYDLLAAVAAARLHESDFAIDQSWIDTLNRLIASGSRQLAHQGHPTYVAKRNEEILSDRVRVLQEFGWVGLAPDHPAYGTQLNFGNNQQAPSPETLVGLLQVLYGYVGNKIMTPVRGYVAITRVSGENAKKRLEAIDAADGLDAAESLLNRPSEAMKRTPDELQLRSGRRQWSPRPQEQKVLPLSLVRDAGWLTLAMTPPPEVPIDQDRIDTLNYKLKETQTSRRIFELLGWVAAGQPLPQDLVPVEKAKVGTIVSNMRTLHQYLGEVLMVVVAKEVDLLRRTTGRLSKAISAAEEAGRDVKEVLEDNPAFFLRENARAAGVARPKRPKPPTRLESRPQPATPPVKSTPVSPPAPVLRPAQAPTSSSQTPKKMAAPKKQAVPVQLGGYGGGRSVLGTPSPERQDSLRKVAARYATGGLEFLATSCPELAVCSDMEFIVVVKQVARAYFTSDSFSDREFARIVNRYLKPKSQLNWHS